MTQERAREILAAQYGRDNPGRAARILFGVSDLHAIDALESYGNERAAQERERCAGIVEQRYALMRTLEARAAGAVLDALSEAIRAQPSPAIKGVGA